MMATAKRMNLDPLTAFLTGVGGVLVGASGFLVAWINRGAKRDELVVTQVQDLIKNLNGELQDVRNRLREVETDVQKLQKELIESQRVIARLEGEKANLEWENKRLVGVNAEQMTELGRLEAQVTEQKRLCRALIRKFRKMHPEETLQEIVPEVLLETTLQGEEILPPDLESFGE